MSEVIGQELPEDFPHRQFLVDAGFDTVEKVRALEGDYKEVAGVGEARGKEIDAYLASGSEESGVIPTPTRILVAGSSFPMGGILFRLVEDAVVTFDGAADEGKYAGALLVSGPENFQLNVPRLERRYSPVHGGVIPFECDNCGKAVPDEIALPQIDAKDNDAEKVYCSADCEKKAGEKE